MSKPPAFSMMHDSNPYDVEFVPGGHGPWWTVIVNGEVFASAKRREQNEWLCMRGSKGRYFGRTAEEAIIQCVKGENKKK